METENKAQKQKTQEPAQAPKGSEVKIPKTPKAKPVEIKLYDAFNDLHFLKLDGAIFTEPAEKEYNQLKKQISACSGKKPKVTKTVSVKGYGIVKLVEGIPVPTEIYQAIEKVKAVKFYF